MQDFGLMVSILSTFVQTFQPGTAHKMRISLPAVREARAVVHLNMDNNIFLI